MIVLQEILKRNKCRRRTKKTVRLTRPSAVAFRCYRRLPPCLPHCDLPVQTEASTRVISAGVTVWHHPEAHLCAEMTTSTDNDPSPAIIHHVCEHDGHGRRHRREPGRAATTQQDTVDSSIHNNSSTANRRVQYPRIRLQDALDPCLSLQGWNDVFSHGATSVVSGDGPAGWSTYCLLGTLYMAGTVDGDPSSLSLGEHTYTLFSQPSIHLAQVLQSAL